MDKPLMYRLFHAMVMLTGVQATCGTLQNQRALSRRTNLPAYGGVVDQAIPREWCGTAAQEGRRLLHSTQLMLPHTALPEAITHTHQHTPHLWKQGHVTSSPQAIPT